MCVKKMASSSLKVKLLNNIIEDARFINLISKKGEEYNSAELGLSLLLLLWSVWKEGYHLKFWIWVKSHV